MNTTKVFHITSRLNVGGIAVQVLNVCAGLECEDFECTIVTGNPSADEGNMLAFSPAPKRLHVIPELGRKIHLWSDILAFIKLCDYFRKERPDIVHTHASKAGALGRLAAFVAHVPIIVHSYHGHVFRHYFPGPVSLAIRMTERFLALLSDAIVVSCESQMREIVDEFKISPRRKVHIVRYGIDAEHFAKTPYSRKGARAHFGLRQDSVVIGAVGRMAPIKNHKLLIDAFARIVTFPGYLPMARRGEYAELLLHGDGPCKAGIEQKVSHGVLFGLHHSCETLKDRVKFVPWVDDLRIVYNAIDVLAIASKAEGMPIAALEAMASGVPVVSMAVGGLADLLDGRGVVVKEHNSTDFAIGICKAICGDVDIFKAKEFAKREHSFGSLVSATREIYLRFSKQKQSHGVD